MGNQNIVKTFSTLKFIRSFCKADHCYKQEEHEQGQDQTGTCLIHDDHNLENVINMPDKANWTDHSCQSS